MRKKIAILFVILAMFLVGGAFAGNVITSFMFVSETPIFEFDVVNSQTIEGEFSSSSEITVDWGDGSENTYNGSDQAYSKDYGTVGNRTVKIYGDTAALTKYTMTTAASNVSFELVDLPSSVTYLWLHNTSSTVTGDTADFSASIERIYLAGACTLTGTLADLSSSIERFYIGSTSSTITGALSDLSSSMEYFHVGDTNSTITGGATAMAATGIVVINTQDCSEDQTTVNSVIDRLYADRASFTYATPELDIAGNNAAPSASPQIDTYIPALQSEGWVITYTSP